MNFANPPASSDPPYSPGPVSGAQQWALPLARVEFAPLANEGKPFWDRPVCPDALAPLLQERPEGINLFAIIDAPRRKAVRGASDLDLLDEALSAQGLFQGSSDLADSGPWLIDLSQPSRARDNWLRDYFTHFTGKGTGVFLRSPASRDELRTHLRGLLKVRPAKDSETLVFFRFWDPLIASVYFGSLGLRPDRVSRIFITRAGLPVEFLAEDGDGVMQHFVPDIPAGTKVSRGELCLDAHDHKVFDKIVLRVLARELTDWLAEAYPARIAPMSPEQRNAIGRHLVRHGMRCGFTLKDEYAYLAHMMLSLGGWMTEPGLYPKIDAILHSRSHARHKPLRKAFAESWSESHFAVLAPRREALIAAIGQEANAPFVTLPAMRRLIATHFVEADARIIWQFLQAVERDFTAHPVPVAQQTAVGLLSLFHGFRFHADPLRRWTTAPLTQPSPDIGQICRAAWEDLIGDNDHG